jgi:hypothetical protein
VVAERDVAFFDHGPNALACRPFDELHRVGRVAGRPVEDRVV